MENMEERQVELCNYMENMEENNLNSEKISKIQKKLVKSLGNFEKKISWKVKWFKKYGRKVSWIVKRFRKYGRKLCLIVKR